MTDDYVRGLIREAWEYFGRGLPNPTDLQALLDQVDRAHIERVWSEMRAEAETAE